MVRTDIEEQLASVSSNQHDEVHRLAVASFNTRTNWIKNSNPTAPQVMDRYPKFTTVPDMVCNTDKLINHTVFVVAFCSGQADYAMLPKISNNWQREVCTMLSSSLAYC
jgi:hypothetical protein